jgi:hypothetical protein
MRWLLYILATGNALFLYMNVEAARRVSNVRPPPMPTHDSVTQLVLLSEVTTTELRRRGEAEAQSDETDAAATPLQPQANEAAVVNSTSGSNATSSGPTAIGASSAMAIAPVSSTKGSASGSVSASASAGAAPVVPSPSNGSPGQLCFNVGPIGEPARAKLVRNWLTKTAGVAVAAREGKRRELSRYWVHLAPFPDAATARSVSNDLAAKGVDDLHLIARGSMANTLSLGVYKRKDSVERRVQQLVALNHRPVVTERFKSVKSTWLEGKIGVKKNFPKSDFKARYNDISLKIGRCHASGQLLRSSALPRITRPESS